MKKRAFAFIVHSRDRHDLPRKFPWLKFFPNFVLDFITLNLPPFIVSPITGLIDKVGETKQGIVIGIPMTARQLLENRNKALERILQAVKLAKSKGVKYIGLGAMTASLSRGGQDVIERNLGVIISTGRTYTIKNILEYAEYCVDLFNLNKAKIRIGIVGAAGGIGSGTAIAMARKGFKNFLLIDLERKATRLSEHIQNLNGNNAGLSITLSHKVSDIYGCNLIIGATSAPEVVITSADLAPGTIVINDAQPSDIHSDVLKNRPDVLVIEGGVLNAPGIDCHFNFGLAHKHDIFSCLAETLWLTYSKTDKHHSIGELDLTLFELMKQDSSKLGFHISDFQNESGYVSKIYLENFAKIIASRQTLI